MHLLSEYDSYRSSHIFAANDKPLSFFVSFYDIPQINKKIESSACTFSRKVLYQKVSKLRVSGKLYGPLFSQLFNETSFNEIEKYECFMLLDVYEQLMYK